MNIIDLAKRNKKYLNRLLLVAVAIAELLLLLMVIWLSIKVINEPDFSLMYNLIAIAILLIWIGVLIGYYVWAIYFYNINLGLTNEDWAEIRTRVAAGEEVQVRQTNPHAGSTLGLPEGTIRGTLALSLAIGALALLIASLGIDHTMPLNELFVDAFDFFKTAFLMMIAFYFGNKSLQYLNYQGGMIKGLPKKTTGDTPAGSPDIAGLAGSGEQNLKSKLNATPLIANGDDLADADRVEGQDFDKPGARG